MLETHIDSEFQKGDLSEEEEEEDFLKVTVSSNRKLYAQKKISLHKLIKIMREFCQLVKVKMVLFEQFISSNYVNDQDSDEECLKKFEIYLYLGLS